MRQLMNSAAGYQSTAPTKADAVSRSAQHVGEITDEHRSLARAMSHLSAQSERGDSAPKLAWDPGESQEP